MDTYIESNDQNQKLDILALFTLYYTERQIKELLPGVSTYMFGKVCY